MLLSLSWTYDPLKSETKAWLGFSACKLPFVPSKSSQMAPLSPGAKMGDEPHSVWVRSEAVGGELSPGEACHMTTVSGEKAELPFAAMRARFIPEK